MIDHTSAADTLRVFHERVFRDGDLCAINELLGEEFVWRQASLPEHPAPGRDGLRDFAQLLQLAIPDLQWSIDMLFAQGDRAVLRWTLRGTHGGPLWGREATHHPLLVTGIHIARVAEGRIIELWQHWGLMGLLQQLGYLPIIGDQTIYPIWDYPAPGSQRMRGEGPI
jgi:steroid delta-isomerase-like uncharacterized protein